jgi:hypothetical protein
LHRKQGGTHGRAFQCDLNRVAFDDDGLFGVEPTRDAWLAKIPDSRAAAQVHEEWPTRDDLNEGMSPAHGQVVQAKVILPIAADQDVGLIEDVTCDDGSVLPQDLDSQRGCRATGCPEPF